MEEQLRFFLKSVENYNSILNGELYDYSKAIWIAHISFIENYLKNFNEIVIYKGFWSGYELYQKPYYRFISDVDFFVSDENYKKLREFFLDLKFNYYFQFSNKIPKFIKNSLEYEMAFSKNLLNFEVHRRLFPPYFIEIDSKKLLKRVVEWKFNLLTFPIEEQFIISVLHFYKSSQKIFYWLWDIFILLTLVDFKKIKEICNYYSIDYEKFIKILEEIKIGKFVRRNLFFKKNFKNYLTFFAFKLFSKL